MSSTYAVAGSMIIAGGPKKEIKEKTAHACEQPGSAHWFGNDGRCVFCECHRDPK